MNKMLKNIFPNKILSIKNNTINLLVFLLIAIVIIGLIFSWSILAPAELRFLISYGADVVEPIWSIEKYLDFVLLLMISTGIAFQLPVLQLILGLLGNYQNVCG